MNELPNELPIYDDICPNCGAGKPKNQRCPSCGSVAIGGAYFYPHEEEKIKDWTGFLWKAAVIMLALVIALLALENSILWLP